MLFLLDTNRYGDENGGVYACTGVGVPVHYKRAGRSDHFVFYGYDYLVIWSDESGMTQQNAIYRINSLSLQCAAVCV